MKRYSTYYPDMFEDDEGEWVKAEIAVEMYDMLASIENDNGQVPDWLWNKIQSVLQKARGE